MDELPPLPASEKEKLALLRDACPRAIRTTRKHPGVGCSECYSAGSQRRTDGPVALNPEPFYGVDAVVRGAFSAADADEAAVSLPMRLIRREVVEFLFDGERFVRQKK